MARRNDNMLLNGKIIQQFARFFNEDTMNLDRGQSSSVRLGWEGGITNTTDLADVIVRAETCVGGVCSPVLSKNLCVEERIHLDEKTGPMETVLEPDRVR
jgi:hypothetical protein